MPTITDILATMDNGPALESDAPAQAWLDGHGRRFGHFIGGRWVRGGQPFDSVDPATDQPLAQVAQGTPAIVDKAVRAAAAALPGWQALGDRGRARHLHALARALQQHARLFALLQTLDSGKPIRESHDADLALAVRHFQHHAGWAQLLAAEFPQRHALGVVGQIVPWNSALPMLAWKIAPALACGNAVVFKPAEQTPLTALLFAELCTAVGLPAGVVNVVTGNGAVGEAIVAHPGVAKIAFTGSTEVGRAIRVATAGSGKRLSLELGGQLPFIVFADADLDAAVEGLVDGAFFNQDQVCRAGSRLLVHEGSAAALLARLEARMTKIRVGAPLDRSSDMGTLVSGHRWSLLNGYVERARAAGATVHQACAGALPAQGCFYPPTLVTGVDNAHEIAQDDVFGPLLTVQTFRTPNEAVDLANHTRHALAASVWSESIGLALEVATRLKAGVVWVNGSHQFDAACGFGGCRESGFGCDGGREGLREYLQPDAPPAATKRAAAPKKAAPLRQSRLPVAVPAANRKDIRNAVEAARAAAGWERQTAHGRARVLHDLAENLAAQHARLVELLAAVQPRAAAKAELQAAVDCLFTAAAWADKFDGAVHQPPLRGLTLALHEPLGVIGVIAPDAPPLLGLLQLVAPALALGNRVVAVPSAALPRVAAELHAVLDTSDLPGGVLEVVTGPADELAATLAAHADVEAFWWPSAAPAQAARAQRLSSGNLKRTWVGESVGDASAVLEQAVQVKNLWMAYGA